jgi:hypothetical protein
MTPLSSLRHPLEISDFIRPNSSPVNLAAGVPLAENIERIFHRGLTLSAVCPVGITPGSNVRKHQEHDTNVFVHLFHFESRLRIDISSR